MPDSRRKKTIERVLQGAGDKEFHFMRTGAYEQLSRKLQRVAEIQLQLQMQIQLQLQIQLRVLLLQLQLCQSAANIYNMPYRSTE